MLQRLPLVINGVDFSEAVSRTEYSIYYEDREGDNAVRMLNGDDYPDILDERPVITWPLNSLWSDELQILYTAIGAGQYTQVTYFSPKINASVTGLFRAKISQNNIGIIDDRGKLFYGMTLTLTSR